jgi:hypothetical protein
MPISANQSEFAKAVADALGLKYVRRLEIVFEVDEPVIVRAEIVADDGLDSVCKTFELSAVEK